MRSRYKWFLGWAAVVLVIDQATKYWAERTLADGHEISVIPSLIDFRLVYNPGAAFSIGVNYTWIFAIAAAAAVVGILYYARRVTSLGWALSLGAVLGGAFSHLGDRLFREPGFARGHVVDFIDYNGFFVGNVADIALVLGAIAMALLSVREIPIRHEDTPAEDTPPADTPAADTPAADTPAVDTPAVDTRAGDTPAEEASAEEAPVNKNPITATTDDADSAGETVEKRTP